MTNFRSLNISWQEQRLNDREKDDWKFKTHLFVLDFHKWILLRKIENSLLITLHNALQGSTWSSSNLPTLAFPSRALRNASNFPINKCQRLFNVRIRSTQQNSIFTAARIWMKNKSREKFSQTEACVGWCFKERKHVEHPHRGL